MHFFCIFFANFSMSFSKMVWNVKNHDLFYLNIRNHNFFLHLKHAIILFYIKDAYRAIVCNKIKNKKKSKKSMDSSPLIAFFQKSYFSGQYYSFYFLLARFVCCIFFNLNPTERGRNDPTSFTKSKKYFFFIEYDLEIKIYTFWRRIFVKGV